MLSGHKVYSGTWFVRVIGQMGDRNKTGCNVKEVRYIKFFSSDGSTVIPMSNDYVSKDTLSAPIDIRNYIEYYLQMLTCFDTSFSGVLANAKETELIEAGRARCYK